MELKEFVKKFLVDLDHGLDEADSKSSRKMVFNSSKGRPTVEFDIAVSVEQTNTSTGKAGIKVLSFIEGAGELESTSKNSTVSRVRFGIDINSYKKDSIPQIKAGKIKPIFDPDVQF